MLPDILDDASCLTTLSLANNGLDDGALRGVMLALAENVDVQLQHLDLSGNQMLPAVSGCCCIVCCVAGWLLRVARCDAGTGRECGCAAAAPGPQRQPDAACGEWVLLHRVLCGWLAVWALRGVVLALVEKSGCAAAAPETVQHLMLPAVKLNTSAAA
jgi:hypothetical protein